MPYLKKAVRESMRCSRCGCSCGATTVAELTYELYSHVMSYLNPDATFEMHAAVLGALEATKLEVYRRYVAPYEDKKILENGDVLG